MQHLTPGTQVPTCLRPPKQRKGMHTPPFFRQSLGPARAEPAEGAEKAQHVRIKALSERQTLSLGPEQTPEAARLPGLRDGSATPGSRPEPPRLGGSPRTSVVQALSSAQGRPHGPCPSSSSRREGLHEARLPHRPVVSRSEAVRRQTCCLSQISSSGRRWS